MKFLLTLLLSLFLLIPPVHAEEYFTPTDFAVASQVEESTFCDRHPKVCAVVDTVKEKAKATGRAIKKSAIKTGKGIRKFCVVMQPVVQFVVTVAGGLILLGIGL